MLLSDDKTLKQAISLLH